MPSDSFTEALEQLDPASRALLDLSLRRGMRTEEIAEVLGAEPDSVAATRDEALRRVAEHVGMTREDQRDEVRTRLAELPAEGWLARSTMARNGDGAPEVEEQRSEGAEEPVAEEAPVAAEPRRRKWLLPIVLLVIVAAIVVAIVALASGGSKSSDSTAKAPGPPQKPAKASPTPKPKHKPAAAPSKGAVTFAAMGGSGARGSARLLSGGKKLQLRVRHVRPPHKASYQVWLYNSVLDARRLAKSRRVPLSVTVRLPANWKRYRFVDVSREPADGNPNHSGASVARVPTSRLR